MIKRLGLMLLLADVVAIGRPTPVIAQAAWTQSEAVWRLMDLCTRNAQKAYPDYTHEDKLKREAYRASCMRSNNLPYEGAPAAGSTVAPAPSLPVAPAQPLLPAPPPLTYQPQYAPR
jgi:hypothetical protein